MLKAMTTEIVDSNDVRKNVSQYNMKGCKSNCQTKN